MIKFRMFRNLNFLYLNKNLLDLTTHEILDLPQMHLQKQHESCLFHVPITA